MTYNQSGYKRPRRKAVQRYDAKRDKNENQIVSELYDMGIRNILLLDEVDLLIGFRGRNILIELKMPGEGLRPGTQTEFHENWDGQIGVAHTTEEVLAILEECTLED